MLRGSPQRSLAPHGLHAPPHPAGFAGPTTLAGTSRRDLLQNLPRQLLDGVERLRDGCVIRGRGTRRAGTRSRQPVWRADPPGGSCGQLGAVHYRCYPPCQPGRIISLVNRSRGVGWIEQPRSQLRSVRPAGGRRTPGGFPRARFRGEMSGHAPRRAREDKNRASRGAKGPTFVGQIARGRFLGRLRVFNRMQGASSEVGGAPWALQPGVAAPCSRGSPGDPVSPQIGR